MTIPNAKKLHVRIYNQNDDLFRVMDMENSDLSWEYNRVGGVGQAQLSVPTSDDGLLSAIRPRFSLKIFINDQVRYWGQIIQKNRIVQSRKEQLMLIAYGYLRQLSDVIVEQSYASTSIRNIVIDILDNDVVPNTDITYDSADIDDPAYTVQSIAFNHSLKDAISLLAQLAGSIEWGVDRNRKFFFKIQSEVKQHFFIIGRDATRVTEERRDDQIVNAIRVFGSAGFILEQTSTQSINLFGKRQRNLFESAISTSADATQLASAILKQSASFKRNIKFSTIQDDLFLEETIPLGRAVISSHRVASKPLYGLHHKYGLNIRYGSKLEGTDTFIINDQFGNIRYKLEAGGIKADINLQNNLTNLGDQQKRLEYEIKELQRR